VYQLVKAGLLARTEEQKAPAKKRVGDGFFPMLEHELKRVMGPMASLIIEDKLAELGESKEFFSQDQVNLFVELLSEEIPNEQKKKEFVRTVMVVLSAEKIEMG